MKTLYRYISIVLLLVLAVSCGAPAASNTPGPVENPTATEVLQLTPTQSIPTDAQIDTTVIPAELVWAFNGGATPFFYPSGIAIDADGNLYVTDTRNGRVVKIDSDGQFLSEWGSNGNGQGQFTSPAGIVVDSQGNVYVADSGNNRIEKFDSGGNFLTTWGSSGTGEGQFAEPYNIAVDGQGQIFVVDRKNSRIQKFDGNGQFLTSWGSQGEADGQFVSIGSIAVDPQGNVYVSDLENNRVTATQFDNNGGFLTKWNDLTCKFSRETASPDEIGGVGGMWFNPEGSLYIGDLSWGRVCIFDRNGMFLGGWGEKGVEAGQLLAPIGIVGDSAGSFYVLDYSSGQVQKFQVK